MHTPIIALLSLTALILLCFTAVLGTICCVLAGMRQMRRNVETLSRETQRHADYIDFDRELHKNAGAETRTGLATAAHTVDLSTLSDAC